MFFFSFSPSPLSFFAVLSVCVCFFFLHLFHRILWIVYREFLFYTSFDVYVYVYKSRCSITFNIALSLECVYIVAGFRLAFPILSYRFILCTLVHCTGKTRNQNEFILCNKCSGTSGRHIKCITNSQVLKWQQQKERKKKNITTMCWREIKKNGDWTEYHRVKTNIFPQNIFLFPYVCR